MELNVENMIRIMKIVDLKDQIKDLTIELEILEKEQQQEELNKAVEMLCKSLREDKDYYMVWKDNIAMSFKDVINLNMLTVNGGAYITLNRGDLHTAANKAADYFLQSLIKE